MRVHVLDLASPGAAAMLQEPLLWPQIVSGASTVADLKADLVRQRVAQGPGFRLHLCTDPGTWTWTYESASRSWEQLHADTLYVRMEPAPAPQETLRDPRRWSTTNGRPTAGDNKEQ